MAAVVVLAQRSIYVGIPHTELWTDEGTGDRKYTVKQRYVELKIDVKILKKALSGRYRSRLNVVRCRGNL